MSVQNNAQIQAGGQTYALLPDPQVVLIGGKRFRVQVLASSGQFEDSHIDPRHLAQVQRAYDSAFNEMSSDAQDRIVNAGTKREVVIFQHDQNGDVQSLSTTTRDAYDQGDLRPRSPALSANHIFQVNREKHTYELKAIGQALRNEPLHVPVPPITPSLLLLGITHSGDHIQQYVATCMRAIFEGQPADQVLQALVTNCFEAHQMLTTIATHRQTTAVELIQNPFVQWIMLPYLRQDPNHRALDNIHTISDDDKVQFNLAKADQIAEAALDYILQNPDAEFEVPLLLANGNRQQQEALTIMNAIMQRLGTQTYYNTANHPSRRLVFLDIITPSLVQQNRRVQQDEQAQDDADENDPLIPANGNANNDDYDSDGSGSGTDDDGNPDDI